MGAWGVEAPSNDTAADLILAILESRNGLRLITTALQRAGSGDNEDEQALAVAELVAAALGNPSGVMDSDAWRIARSLEANALANLSLLALQAVERVREGKGRSSLNYAWADSPYYPEWLEYVRDLMRRLGRQDGNIH